MSDLPDWVAAKLPPAARHSGLAIASLGDAKTLGRGGFALTSPAFENGEERDPCFTAKEEDAVAPPLEWTAPPPGSQELVVIVEDASSDAADPAAASGQCGCHRVADLDFAGGDGARKPPEVQIGPVDPLHWQAERQVLGVTCDIDGFQQVHQRWPLVPGQL